MNRLIHKTPLQDNVVKGERKEILISFPNQSNVTGRNRMHVAVDDKHYSYYAYDYSGGSCGSREQSQACLSYAEMEQRRRGQRRIKLTGDNSVLDVNADYMRTISTLENVTLYPSAYMVLTDRGYTKHYYTGMERVAARIGDGGLDVGFYLSNTDSLHARANRLFSQSLAQVNRRVLEANDMDCIMDGEMPVEELGIPFEAIPEQMSATVGTEYGEFLGAMHLVSNAGESPEVYYYHGDHLGSASWITDASGTAVQHLQYLPFGERFVDQRTSGYSERFTFTGKERDEETGYGYFGARYMDYELMTMWLSVDPMADKYPNISPYAYCSNNPIILIDPDGQYPSIPEPQKTIANAITASAELAHSLYMRSAAIVQAHPSMLSMVNSSLSLITKGIEKVTDMNPQTMGWVDLTNIWLFELGNSPNISFGPNARTTQDLKKQQGVNDARNMAIDNIKNGQFDDVSYTWQYGQNQYYEGIKEGDVVTSFLGSYNTTVKINPGNKDGEYVLEFQANNISSWESATRLRKDNDGDGRHDGIIPSKERGAGIRLGGNFKQTWKWSETINVE